MTFEIEDIYWDDCIHVENGSVYDEDDEDDGSGSEMKREEEAEIEQHPLVIWKDTIIPKRKRRKKRIKDLIYHFRYDVKREKNSKNGDLIIEWLPSYVSPKDIKIIY